MSTYYNWCNRHFHVPQFFLIPYQGRGTYHFFYILSVLIYGPMIWQIPQFYKFSLFYWLLQGLVVWPRLGDLFVCQNPIEVSVLFSMTNSGWWIYHLFVWSKSNFLLIIIYSFSVFHISVSWWFFTGVWMTASLLKSPGLVSGFWPFSAMLSFG